MANSDQVTNVASADFANQQNSKSDENRKKELTLKFWLKQKLTLNFWLSGVAALLVGYACSLSPGKILEVECENRDSIKFTPVEVVDGVCYWFGAVLIVGALVSIMHSSSGCKKSFSVDKNVSWGVILDVAILCCFAFASAYGIVLNFKIANANCSKKTMNVNYLKAIYGTNLAPQILIIVLNGLFLTVSRLLSSTDSISISRNAIGVGILGVVLSNGSFWIETFLISITQNNRYFAVVSHLLECDNKTTDANLTGCRQALLDYQNGTQRKLLPFVTEYALAAIAMCHKIHKKWQGTTEKTILKQQDSVSCSNNVRWRIAGVLAVISLIVATFFCFLNSNVTNDRDEHGKLSNDTQTSIFIANVFSVVLHGLSTIFYFVFFMIFLAGFSRSTDDKKDLSLSFDEAVILITSIALAGLAVIKIEASANCLQNHASFCHISKTRLPDLEIAASVMSILHVLFQTTLVIILSKSKPKKNSELEKAFYLYFSTTNIIFWGTDTFFWSSNNVYGIQSSLHERSNDWNFFVSSLFSLATYYRFVCAIIFFDAAFDFFLSKERGSILQRQHTAEMHLQRSTDLSP